MQKNNVNKENTILNVINLCVQFKIKGKIINVLNDISFKLNQGDTVGIVGESGCGKSMTGLALMRMIPSPPGWISSGNIILHGQDIIKVSENKMRDLRGREISMIFQEPMTSLNPVFTVGNQISETILRHSSITKSEAHEKVLELLELVKIPDPAGRISQYPHELSGGMRQRIMIAMALACDPDVLIADEPTTALDVTVQAQIFDLLKEIQEERGTCIILITHDFGAVAEMADRIIVMYAGHKVEEGSIEQIESDALHPYTQGLLRCMPGIQLDTEGVRNPLFEIPGTVPDLLRYNDACPFAPRCSYVMAKCKKLPREISVGVQHSIKCWKYNNTV